MRRSRKRIKAAPPLTFAFVVIWGMGTAAAQLVPAATPLPGERSPATGSPPPAGAVAPAPPNAVRPAIPAPSSVSPVPPTAERSAAAPPSTLEEQPAPAVENQPLVAPRVVETADATAAESDHDLVVGAWGVEVRALTTTQSVFSRRATTGCPLATATPAGMPPQPAPDCPPVGMSILGVRHWVNRNLAWTAGAALAMGGGSQGGRLLDSYFGFGPSGGISVLLGNWRHLSVSASPSLSLVWFKAAGSAPTTYLVDLRAELEGELHLGFIGVPALSLGIRSGMLLRLEKAADLTVWSAGVAGATTPRALVSDVTLRYYF